MVSTRKSLDDGPADPDSAENTKLKAVLRKLRIDGNAALLGEKKKKQQEEEERAKAGKTYHWRGAVYAVTEATKEEWIEEQPERYKKRMSMVDAEKATTGGKKRKRSSVEGAPSMTLREPVSGNRGANDDDDNHDAEREEQKTHDRMYSSRVFDYAVVGGQSERSCIQAQRQAAAARGFQVDAIPQSVIDKRAGYEVARRVCNLARLNGRMVEALVKYRQLKDELVRLDQRPSKENRMTRRMRELEKEAKRGDAKGDGMGLPEIPADIEALARVQDQINDEVTGAHHAEQSEVDCAPGTASAIHNGIEDTSVTVSSRNDGTILTPSSFSANKQAHETETPPTPCKGDEPVREPASTSSTTHTTASKTRFTPQRHFMPEKHLTPSCRSSTSFSGASDEVENTGGITRHDSIHSHSADPYKPPRPTEDLPTTTRGGQPMRWSMTRDGLAAQMIREGRAEQAIHRGRLDGESKAGRRRRVRRETALAKSWALVDVEAGQQSR